jgi:hypothetical protein
MQISVRHHLRVGLGSGSAHAVQQLLLTPISGPTQTVKDWKVDCDGMAEAAHFFDAYANRADLVSQTRPEGDLTINVAGAVVTHDRNGVLGRIGGEPGPAIFRRVTALTKADAAAYADVLQPGMGRIGLLHALMARIGEEVGGPMQLQEQDGQSQSEPASDPDAKEFAHAFIAAARSLDIPARFVHGYLLGEEGESSGFHAWAEAYDDDLGWIGFDPKLGYCPTDRHVRVAIGLDALSAAPVRSVPNEGETELLELSVTGSADTATPKP